jgi:hypothetical protein
VLRRRADGLAPHWPASAGSRRAREEFRPDDRASPKPAFKSNQPNEIHPDRRVGLNGEIYIAVGLIAVGLRITSSNGAKQRQAPDPGLTQLRLKGAQDGDYALGELTWRGSGHLVFSGI